MVPKGPWHPSSQVMHFGADFGIKVAVHTCDVWRKNLTTTQSQASLITSCIVNLFNTIELLSIAMPCGGQ